ncbi:uncharacterized protein CCR75_001844 [Bremia lactucae]|uniref:Uncharacterized protein n=1 Tax=Bremia lactucae TaxID=4779 RepID=A0A976FFV2_BRELC|nr:hypothetical protein CCR75_001844 [Bremia lactucae]
MLMEKLELEVNEGEMMYVGLEYLSTDPVGRYLDSTDILKIPSYALCNFGYDVATQTKPQIWTGVPKEFRLASR